MNQYIFREENFEELYRNYEKIEIKKCIICHSDKFTKWTKESYFQAYKCNDCALIFMNPQLSEEGLNKRCIKNKTGEDESIFLRSIKNILLNNKTKAETSIEKFKINKSFNFLYEKN